MVDRLEQAKELLTGKTYPRFKRSNGYTYKISIDDLIQEFLEKDSKLSTLRAYCHVELHHSEGLPSHIAVHVICDAND